MQKTSSITKRQPRAPCSQIEEQASITGSKWSAEEESKLVALMEKIEAPSWPKIAKQFPGRSAAQCQAKWQEVLKRDSKKGNWTAEEDELLKKWVITTN